MLAKFMLKNDTKLPDYKDFVGAKEFDNAWLEHSYIVSVMLLFAFNTCTSLYG